MHVWQVAPPPSNSAIARSKTVQQSPKQKRLHRPVRDDIETEREVWLWDFAGQPDYRLIHQLYMDETALALMVIDPQRDQPFESLGHWEKALTAAVKHEPAKLLVAGRCDRGGVTISRTKLAQYCQAHSYSEFLNTSAKTGAGLAELKAAIAKHIPWERLPWTATSRLFKTLKDAILRIKQEGIVLLQPEQINNYASAVVRCARENSEDIGCVSEREVLEAQIAFPPDMKRLKEADEKILLRAMVETFVNRALCMREETGGTQLVFLRISNKTGPRSPIIRTSASPTVFPACWTRFMRRWWCACITPMILPRPTVEICRRFHHARRQTRRLADDEEG
jgi:GTPase SAR1 family protein